MISRIRATLVPPKKSAIQEARRKLLDGIGVPEQRPFSADAFQLSAIESIEKEKDTLVIAPTGTGKTFIAIEGIRRAIEQGKRAVYTAPLKALSNTKYTELKRLFEPKYSVGLLTGDRKIDTDADVVVATTEIYRNDLYNFGADYSLVVLDELHYLADAQRGPVWEESIILSPKSATLLMLSASISNPEEIAEWITQVRGGEVQIISETNRPVELRLAFLHPRAGILPVEGNNGRLFPEVASFYNQGSSRGRRGGRGRGESRRPKKGTTRKPRRKSGRKRSSKGSDS